MNVSARHYATGAEIIASAHAIRQRLMAPKNAFKPSKPQLALVTVNLAAEPPLWQRQDIHFDEHVKAWQWNFTSSHANKAKAYIVARCVQIGVDFNEIMGRSHQRHIAGPRQLLMYELKTKFGLSYPRIGKEFNRDSSTAVHAVQNIAKRRGEQTPECLTAEVKLLTDHVLKAAVRKEYQQGASISDLNLKYNLSTRAISAVIKLENWVRDYRGDKPPRFRQVKVNLAMLRSEYQDGYPLKRLAERHGISSRTIARMAVAHG
jgi:Mor family transcriptional regulator